MSPSLPGNSTDFPPRHQTSKHTRGPHPPQLPKKLSASLRPPRSHPTNPGSPPASPQARTGLLQLLPCYQDFPQRQTVGASSTPRQQLSRVLAPFTSAARQRGTFLSHSGFQLGGPGALLPVTQSPPRARARLTNQLFFPARRRALRTQSGRLGDRPMRRLPPLSHCAHARGWARCVGFRSALALCSHCSSSGSKPYAVGVQENQRSECNLNCVLP